MPYCVASISPAGTLSRQLYPSVEAARDALIGELKKLRSNAANSDDADEINGVLDELESNTHSDYLTYFSRSGEQWVVWYHEIGEGHVG